MCILFLHTNLNPLRGRFKLILAVNRDEAYKRPTLPAYFWTEDRDVIGGRDMEPGREGGTWLAMSKSGRIACLLNILSSRQAEGNLLGRGNLVVEYVLGSMDSVQYLDKIAESGDKYSPFTLLALQLSSKQISVSACSNAEGNKSSVNLNNGTVGLGNSLIARPFLKVREGTKRFDYLVKEFGSVETKEALKENLLTLLKWDQQHFPDPELQSRGSHLPEERVTKLSSVFVKLPAVYGTRTHTLILVDAENNVDFVEWTMKEPINSDEPVWSKVEKNFQLSI